MYELDDEETWWITRFKLDTVALAGALISDPSQLFSFVLPTLLTFGSAFFRNWSGASAVLDPAERARSGQIESAPGEQQQGPARQQLPCNMCKPDRYLVLPARSRRDDASHWH